MIASVKDRILIILIVDHLTELFVVEHFISGHIVLAECYFYLESQNIYVNKN